MYKTLTALQLQAQLLTEAKPYVVDVRNYDEFAGGHIPGAYLLPLGQLAERYEELSNYKDSPLVIYCKAGVRSAMACEWLAVQGFSQLYNLVDGILGWQRLTLRD